MLALTNKEIKVQLVVAATNGTQWFKFIYYQYRNFRPCNSITSP